MGRALLIMSAGFLIVLGLVQRSMNSRQQVIPVRTYDYHHELQVENLDNSLMDYAIAELDNNQQWSAGYSSADFFGGEGSITVYTYDDYTNDDVPPDHSIEGWNKYTILLVSEAIANGLKSSTEVGMTKDAFSKYTYFTDIEPSNIYFFDGDTLTGPVHTNGTLKIAGSPVFQGEVTSPNPWEGHPSYTNDPQFESDTTFNHPTIELPLGENLDDLKSMAVTGGLKFTEDIFVEFIDDGPEGSEGSVDISFNEGSPSNPSWSVPQNYDLSVLNGVISSTEKVYTKGIVQGKVTLHSGKEIEIMGDLRYHTNPLEEGGENSTDLLGLVSERNVIVDEDAHEDDGSQDLDIFASIMAMDKSFEVENYASGSAKGTLNLVGGIQQKERGPVGTFNGSGIQSGFSKSYKYDERLRYMVTPGYPRESVYTYLYWKDKPLEKVEN